MRKKHEENINEKLTSKHLSL